MDGVLTRIVSKTEVNKIKVSRNVSPKLKKFKDVFFLLSVLALSLSACNFGPPVEANLEPQITLTFSVYRDGTSSVYHADSLTTSSTYTGTLKFVVQSAATEINAVDSGTIRFQAGDFDLGPDWFELNYISDVIFEGQGIDVTTLRNNSSAFTDTEPFDCTGCDRLTIRDLTVSAGGPARSSSDALDFDGGDDIVIERVKVTSARGRGIVFDGKGPASINLATADRNVIRDCVITGVPSHGIELLASNFNLVENCTITDVGGTGIILNKASSSASQPNKQSNDNTLINNDITNAGRDGIYVNSSSRNLIKNNIILNSSDDVTSRDGIRLESTNSIVCDDNRIEGNTSSDNQTPKTQSYGLKIVSAACNRTVVGTNNLTGNRVGSMFNGGTGTVYSGTTLTLTPSADASLQSDMPTTNFGSTASLTVDGNPVRHILLKFSVTGIGGRTITKATLKLYNTNGSVLGGNFYRVADSSWSETGVTWNTAPASDAIAFASLGAVSSGNWYEVNVASVVTGNGDFTIKITSTNADGANYASRNNSTSSLRPQLILELAP
jgi:parallel beta-helix repeat protein